MKFDRARDALQGKRTQGTGRNARNLNELTTAKRNRT
jgi:hypothetical protein